MQMSKILVHLKFPFFLSISFFLLFYFFVIFFVFDGTAGDTDEDAVTSKPKITNFDITLFYEFQTVEAKRIALRVNIPRTIWKRQKVHSVEYSREPNFTFNIDGNSYADFIFKNCPPYFNLAITVKGEMFDYDMSTVLQDSNEISPALDLWKYLGEERMIEINSPAIVAAADKIGGADDLEIVYGIYNFVLDNVEPDISGFKGKGALMTIKTKRGMCIDYSDIFVALCRAKKIPAKVVGGLTTEYVMTPRHAWVEVYFNDLGWVPFDPVRGRDESEQTRKKYFYDLQPNYLYFTDIRNDTLLKNNYMHVFSSDSNEISFRYAIIFRQPIEQIYTNGLL